jgi:hypothetical protein
VGFPQACRARPELEETAAEEFGSRSELGSGTGGIERRGEGNAAAREREEVKARWWAVHGDEEVAAGEGSGSSWRAREGPPGERKWTGKGWR